MNKIAFTLDIDWAPEEVIKHALDIFSKYKAKCTLFCTHNSKIIKNSDKSIFEIAIHPNFNENLFDNSSKAVQDTLDDLLEIYPEALGVRSHSLTHNSKLQSLFFSKGLKYDSNMYIPIKKFLPSPFKCFSGMTRIPFHWEDDIHFTEGKSFDYKIRNDLNFNDCIILNFHPIHVYLNTDSEHNYLSAKSNYHDAKKLKNFINKEKVGTKDFLISQLEKAQKNNYEHYNLKELII